MNKKSTNRLIAILNVISILAIVIFYFSKSYLECYVMTRTGEKSESMFNSIIINILVNNIKVIFTFIYGGLGIINLICSVQNRKSKKIALGQLAFAICEIGQVIKGLFSEADEILGISNIVICGVMAIILFIQFIFIHNQDKDIFESKIRKISNIILYYVLQLVLVAGFTIIVISALSITKINSIKWKKSLETLYNEVSNLKGVTISDVYVPVKEDTKYGFIDEKGKEIIECQYDSVTYFNEMKFNDNKYYIALAKKDGKFYVLSKNNDICTIDGFLEKCLQRANSYFTKRDFNSQNDDFFYVQNFEFIFQGFMQGNLVQQTSKDSSKNNKLPLNVEEKNIYSLSTANYSMQIELVESQVDDSYYEDNNLSDSDTIFKVTVIKDNGQLEVSEVYLPGFDEYDSILNTFSNGYIEFQKVDDEKMGWYDSNGNQIEVSEKYSIKDIKDDKVILEKNVYSNEENRDEKGEIIVLDMNGKKLFQAADIIIYDNVYFAKKENGKMVLVDTNFESESKEYDKIIDGKYW